MTPEQELELFEREVRRCAALMRQPNAIFVFGSNLAGNHGAGAALIAHQLFGAEMGKGAYRTGRCFAIPTKSMTLRTLQLTRIREYIDQLKDYARMHDELIFAVTRVGCGLAGYTDADIAPMFKGAPSNCELPEGWREINNE